MINFEWIVLSLSLNSLDLDPCVDYYSKMKIPFSPLIRLTLQGTLYANASFFQPSVRPSVGVFPL